MSENNEKNTEENNKRKSEDFKGGSTSKTSQKDKPNNFSQIN